MSPNVIMLQYDTTQNVNVLTCTQNHMSSSLVYRTPKNATKIGKL